MAPTSLQVLPLAVSMRSQYSLSDLPEGMKILYGVNVVDFSDRHIFVNNFIYHIKMVKGVYTDRHKVGIVSLCGLIIR